MRSWLKRANKPGDTGWRNRRAARFAGTTVRCELGEIADISASGVRIKCGARPPVKPGQVVPMRLRFSDGSVRLECQVRWCRRKGLRRFELGLQFVNLKPGMTSVLDAVARFGMAAAAKKDAGKTGRSGAAAAGRRQQQTDDRPALVADLPNYFRVLGLTPAATDAQIKASYRKLAVSCHPDRSDEPDAMKRFEQINEAYHVLVDPQRREAYLRMAG